MINWKMIRNNRKKCVREREKKIDKLRETQREVGNDGKRKEDGNT